MRFNSCARAGPFLTGVRNGRVQSALCPSCLHIDNCFYWTTLDMIGVFEARPIWGKRCLQLSLVWARKPGSCRTIAQETQATDIVSECILLVLLVRDCNCWPCGICNIAKTPSALNLKTLFLIRGNASDVFLHILRISKTVTWVSPAFSKSPLLIRLPTTFKICLPWKVCAIGFN